MRSCMGYQGLGMYAFAERLRRPCKAAERGKRSEALDGDLSASMGCAALFQISPQLVAWRKGPAAALPVQLQGPLSLAPLLHYCAAAWAAREA